MSWNTTSLPKVRIYTKPLSNSQVATNPFNPLQSNPSKITNHIEPKRFSGSEEFKLLSYAQEGDKEKLKNLEEKLELRFKPLPSINTFVKSITNSLRLAFKTVSKTINWIKQKASQIMRFIIQAYDVFANIVNNIWAVLGILFLPFKLVFWLLKMVYKLLSYLVSNR